LVGLLTIAGLTACGDKVTIPPVQTTPVGTVVHSVTVSPSAASINVGGTFTFAASVDADAGVSNRTVTWSSSDNTVATVTSAGVVTGVKAGTVSIKATSVADGSVSGAAALTVSAGPTTGTMSVQIVGVRQTNGAGQSVPALVGGAAGQLDIDVNVDPAGQTLKTVSVTIKNPATGDSVAVASNVAYRSGSAFLGVPGAVYDLTVRYPGSNTAVIVRTAVSLSLGHVYTISSRGDMTVTSTTATNRPQLDNTANR
jgi:hypothetical protein